MPNSHSVNEETQGKFLSRLFAAQSIMATLPSAKTVGEFIVKTVKSIPGVADCNICLRAVGKPIGNIKSKKCSNCALFKKDSEIHSFFSCKLIKQKDRQTYSLFTADYFYGVLSVQVADQEKFIPFDAIVHNLTNSVAIILENWKQKEAIETVNNELQQYQKHLEELVSERTRKLDRTNHLLSMLSSGNQSLICSNDETELLHKVCNHMLKLGEYKFVWVGFAENDKAKSVKIIAKAGREKGYLQSVKMSKKNIRFSDTPMGTVIRTKKSFVIQNIQQFKKHPVWRKEIIGRGFHSVASIPLVANHSVLGGITIYSDRSNDFPEDNMKILEEMASDLAFGIMALRRKIELSKAKNKFELLLKRTAGVIALINEKRDPYTAGHQERTASLAHAIAKEIGLSDEIADIIHLGTTIHDIGKIHIPAEILANPGRLLDQEVELIHLHPIIGHEIVKPVSFPWPEICNIIFQHHERLDGSGYPLGLKAHEISLEAKIVAVADTIEAMASHRPYRPAPGIEKALKEINKQKGKLYDASIVMACIRLFQKKGFTFPAQQKKFIYP